MNQLETNAKHPSRYGRAKRLHLTVDEQTDPSKRVIVQRQAETEVRASTSVREMTFSRVEQISQGDFWEGGESI